MRKRLLSLLLCAVMVLSLLPGAGRAAETGFSDVRTGDWFYEAVQFVCEQGLMNGTGSGRFSPNDATTRGMIVTILYRLEGAPAAGTADFADVASGAYYETPAAWAAANGIINGYGDRRFGPNDVITREQLASILYRYAGYKGYDTASEKPLDGFRDAAQVSAYAGEALRWACGSGLINGMDGNRLAPQGSATRAQVAAILMRFLSALGSDGPYTVRFETDGGTPVASQTVNRGERVRKPQDPTREGAAFMGWYRTGEGADYDFSAPVTASFTLYAQWAEKAEGGDTIYAYDPSHVAEEDGLQFIDNIVLAFTKPNLSAAEKDKIAASIGGAVAGSMTEVADILQIRVPRSSYAELMDMAAALERLDKVYSATCDLAGLDAMADDTATWQDTDPWGEGKERKDWWAEATHCYEAWREFSEYFTPIKVGVVDSGVLPSHEDLRVSFPSPYFHNISTPDFHGTAVAGLIAARNNNVGMCGVAYQAQLVCVDKNTGGTRFVDCFHKYNSILRSGAKVINNSFGAYCFTQTAYETWDRFQKDRDAGLSYTEWQEQWAENNVVAAAKCIADYTCSVIQKGWDPLFIQAAGNGMDNHGPGVNAIHSSWWATLTRTNTVSIAAKYGMTSDELLEHIVIVGAVQDKKQGDDYLLTKLSNFGETVSICAPGDELYTTSEDGGYCKAPNLFGGTSGAAPIVSGAAALVWSINPSLTAGEVKHILVTNHSVNAVGLKPEHGTYPMLDVHAACAAAVETLESNKTTGTGKVFANYTHTAGLPLDGATVTLTRTNDGASQICTTDAAGKYSFRLGEGRYHITFACEGFTTSEADFAITRDLANKDYVEFQDVYLDPVDTAHSTHHTLRVCFVDAATGAQLSLTELFGEENDAGEREGYGVAYLALCDAQNDDFYMGGFLRDSIVIEGNYLVFENIESGDQYYISFDAVFNDGYRLPYSPDMEKIGRDSEWSYGYFEVSGTQATTVIRVPLQRSGMGGR